MNKASLAVAIVALVVIGGLFLSTKYGFTASVDQTDPTTVAAAFTTFFAQTSKAGFFHRADRAAYELLTPEAKDLVNASEGPLRVRLIEWSRSQPPFTLDVTEFVEEGSKATVHLIWHYGDGTAVAKKVYLSKLGEKWYIYSIVNNQ